GGGAFGGGAAFLLPGPPALRGVRESGQLGEEFDPQPGQFGHVGPVEQGGGEAEARPQAVAGDDRVDVDLDLGGHARVLGGGQIAQVLGGQPAETFQSGGDIAG